MNKELFKKVNSFICGLLFIYIVWSVIYTTGTIIKNNILAYLFDLFIGIECFWILEEIIKENKKLKERK